MEKNSTSLLRLIKSLYFPLISLGKKAMFYLPGAPSLRNFPILLMTKHLLSYNIQLTSPQS